MTRLGALLALFAVAGLLWVAMIAAAAAIVDLDGVYAVFAAVFVTLALLMLRQIAKEA